MAPPSVEWALVLSGGHLREKVVIPTVSTGGRHFTAVFKESSVLCQFLSGQRPKLHPLKESVVFTDLSRLRNAASTIDAEECADGGDPGDASQLDDIGLDLAPESRRRRPKYYRSKQKRIVDIKVGDSSMAVLSGKGQASVYMEVTTENMTLLHRLVSTSLQALAQEDESVEEAPAPHTPSRHDDLGLGLVEHTPEKHSQGEQEVSTEAGCSDRRGKIGWTAARHVGWIAKRKSWVVRYKDECSREHQKYFKAMVSGDVDEDSSKSDARALAIAWQAERLDALRGLS